MAVGLVNYITDFPALREEVLPRMARLGLRQAQRGPLQRQLGATA
jgi:hypothetical protein